MQVLSPHTAIPRPYCHRNIPLPSDQDSGRITVYMNGESVFDADLNFQDLNWTFFHTFYGSGTAEAEVYLNGEPYKTYSLDFGNG